VPWRSVAACCWSKSILNYSCHQHGNLAAQSITGNECGSLLQQNKLMSGRWFGVVEACRPRPQALTHPCSSSLYSCATAPPTYLPLPSRIFVSLLHTSAPFHRSRIRSVNRSIHSSYRAYSNMSGDLQWPAAKVRQTYIDFFKEKGHTFGILRFYCT
jgi:hypothetical protein